MDFNFSLALRGKLREGVPRAGENSLPVDVELGLDGAKALELSSKALGDHHDGKSDLGSLTKGGSESIRVTDEENSGDGGLSSQARLISECAISPVFWEKEEG